MLNVSRVLLALATGLTALLLSVPAQAYIGPGAGLPVLGSLIGLVVTFFVVVGAILFWPIRKMMRKKKKAAAEATEDSVGQDSGSQ